MMEFHAGSRSTYKSDYHAATIHLVGLGWLGLLFGITSVLDKSTW